MSLRSRLKFVPLIVVVVAYLVGVAMYSHQNRAVTTLMAEIRSKGEPVCASDLYGQPIPDSENAAIAYSPVFDALSSGAAARDMKELRTYLQRYNGVGIPLSDRDWSAFKGLVTTYDHLIPEIRAAAIKPSCQFSIRWEDTANMLLPHLARLRDAHSLVCAKAAFEARSGSSESAADCIALSFLVSDAVRHEPSIVSQLVRYSTITTTTNTLRTTLEEAEPDARAIAALKRSLSGVDVSDSYRTALMGERASFRTMFDDLIAGRIAVDESDAGLRGAALRKIPYFNAWLRADQRTMMAYLTRQVESAESPYRELGSNPTADPDHPAYAVMSRNLCGVYPKALARRDRTIAHINGSRIALDLCQFKLKHGVYPAKLEELHSGTGGQFPEDPFTGQPFVYKRVNKGYLLYSIGDDLVDGGGTKPAADADADVSSGDIVWRAVR